MDRNRNIAFTTSAPLSSATGGRTGRNFLPSSSSTSSRRPPHTTVSQLVPGEELNGVVKSIKPFGAFVTLSTQGLSGLIHISELTHGFVSDVGDIVSIGDNVKVRVLSHDARTGRIALSLKQSYERSIALGDDWGHPWGDDPDNPTKWVDMGRRPQPQHHHWQVDPRRRARLDGGNSQDTTDNARR